MITQYDSVSSLKSWLDEAGIAYPKKAKKQELWALIEKTQAKRLDAAVKTSKAKRKKTPQEVLEESQQFLASLQKKNSVVDEQGGELEQDETIVELNSDDDQADSQAESQVESIEVHDDYELEESINDANDEADDQPDYKAEELLNKLDYTSVIENKEKLVSYPIDQVIAELEEDLKKEEEGDDSHDNDLTVLPSPYLGEKLEYPGLHYNEEAVIDDNDSIINQELNELDDELSEPDEANETKDPLEEKFDSAKAFIKEEQAAVAELKESAKTLKDELLELELDSNYNNDLTERIERPSEEKLDLIEGLVAEHDFVITELQTSVDTMSEDFQELNNRVNELSQLTHKEFAIRVGLAAFVGFLVALLVFYWFL